MRTHSGRNPLTGLSGLQPKVEASEDGTEWASRNPLTGLSGLQLGGRVYLPLRTQTPRSRNPLTGLSGLQPKPPPPPPVCGIPCRNPLTGLSGLQP